MIAGIIYVVGFFAMGAALILLVHRAIVAEHARYAGIPEPVSSAEPSAAPAQDHARAA
jgi:hypothetical protein